MTGSCTIVNQHGAFETAATASNKPLKLTPEHSGEDSHHAQNMSWNQQPANQTDSKGWAKRERGSRSVERVRTRICRVCRCLHFAPHATLLTYWDVAALVKRCCCFGKYSGSIHENHHKFTLTRLCLRIIAGMTMNMASNCIEIMSAAMSSTCLR